MAHLSFEYSANLEPELDMQAFCNHLRDAMVGSGVFPLGGIRVRGTRVDVSTVASGADEIGFIDMTMRMGMGRGEDVRVAVTETIYEAAEAWLTPQIAARPFALSLEVMEIEPRFSEKRFNTVHQFLKDGEAPRG